MYISQSTGLKNECDQNVRIGAEPAGNVHLMLKWSIKSLYNGFCAHLIWQETGVANDAIGRESSIADLRDRS